PFVIWQQRILRAEQVPYILGMENASIKVGVVSDLAGEFHGDGVLWSKQGFSSALLGGWSGFAQKTEQGTAQFRPMLWSERHQVVKHRRLARSSNFAGKRIQQVRFNCRLEVEDAVPDRDSDSRTCFRRMFCNAIDPEGQVLDGKWRAVNVCRFY